MGSCLLLYLYMLIMMVDYIDAAPGSMPVFQFSEMDVAMIRVLHSRPIEGIALVILFTESTSEAHVVLALSITQSFIVFPTRDITPCLGKDRATS
jgi:hypothetical protein